MGWSKRPEYEGLTNSALVGRYAAKPAVTVILKGTGLRAEVFRKAIVITAPKLGRTSMLGREPSMEAIGPVADFQAPIVENNLGTMTVTGTHIRDAVPVGANLMQLDTDYLERSGLSTVQDVIRTLPQNFSGGVGEDTSQGNEGNVARSSSFNLRGLGSSATLVLLNGHRMAPSGISAAFVDVSSIPLAAVEKIEILTDGSSALYGSDAVGGVVNIILKRDYEGAETHAQVGSVTSGSQQERSASQLFGQSWQGGNITALYNYYNRDALPSRERRFAANSDLTSIGGNNFSGTQSSLPNISTGGITYAIREGEAIEGELNRQNMNEGRDILGSHEMHSGFVAASQAIGDFVTLYVDTLLSDRHSIARNMGTPATFTIPIQNPYRIVPNGVRDDAQISVLYNFGRSLGPRSTFLDVSSRTSTVEAAVSMWGGWQSKLSITDSYESIAQTGTNNYSFAALSRALADPDARTAFNSFGSNSVATLDAIRSSTFYGSSSEVSGVNWLADGRMFKGRLRTAFGIDHRRQTFMFSNRSANESTLTRNPRYERDVSAAFAELQLSITPSLSVSVAGREDKYEQYEGTFSPRLAAEWSPMRNVFVHGSWGTSFRTPNLVDLNEAANASQLAKVADSGGTQSTVLSWFGNNADLESETAETWSAGIRWTPTLFSNLDVSYWNIVFDNRIQTPTATDAILVSPRFASLVNRTPSDEERAVVCSRSQFFGAGDCMTSPIDAIVDLRINNLARTSTSGIDISSQWGAQVNEGFLSLSANGTYTLAFNERATRSAPSVALLDRVSNPLRFRGSARASWERAGWTTTTTLNVTGSYVDNVSAPARHVRSHFTIDLNVSYEVDPAATGILAGCRVAISAQNLFDRNPPFVNNPSGVAYDRENFTPQNRFVSLRLEKKW
jgi:outer membrane receptor protein involved in Fe transport